MVIAFGLLLTVLVVLYVGQPLFVREPATAGGDVLEAAIAARRRARPAAPAKAAREVICPKCRAGNEPGDKYCAQCGALLARRA